MSDKEKDTLEFKPKTSFTMVVVLVLVVVCRTYKELA